MYKNPRPIDLRVGQAILFWRRFNGDTQGDVVARMHAYRPMLTKWEHGYVCPKLEQFLRLAKALNVSPYILALTMEAFDE